MGCQCSTAQVQTQVRAGHYPRCSVPTSHQHAAVPSQHPCCNIAWEKSNPTVFAITFRHITFGRTAWVFAILTRPLHTQGAKNTESVDQPSFCNVPWDSSQEHLAGVDGVLVVSGRQLPAPGAGCFVHSCCLPMKPGFSLNTEGILRRVQKIPGRPRRCSRPSFRCTGRGGSYCSQGSLILIQLGSHSHLQGVSRHPTERQEG